MQTLAQGSPDSYSWESTLCGSNPTPTFFFSVNPKARSMWRCRPRQGWVGAYRCSISIPWRGFVPVDGDSGSSHSGAADKGFQTRPASLEANQGRGGESVPRLLCALLRRPQSPPSHLLSTGSVAYTVIHS